MLTIAGGVILGGIGLFVLYMLFAFFTMKGRPKLIQGLLEGLKGFRDGMKGITDDRKK
jgi:hypothetical protein